MYFNIAYDIVTLVLVLSMAVSSYIRTSQILHNSKAFKTAILLLGISTSFDILAAITGGDVFWDSDELNIIFETFYMCTGLYCLYATFITVAGNIDCNYHRSSQFIFALVTVYTFLLLINFPTRLLYDIVDGKYNNHILFYVAYTIPVFVMIHTIIVLVINRNNLKKKVYVAMLIATVCPIVGVLIQLFDERLILIQFSMAITLLILNFIWETPDAQKIEKAVAELEMARISEEKDRKNVEMVGRVKERFLNNISGELLEPIDDIQEYAKQIYEQNDDEDIKQDAENIINAADQFKELLGQITGYSI